MKINRKKCLHMLGAVYLLYILFYFNIPHFLPDYEEMRAWVSVLMFLLVLGGGIAAVFILLWKLRIKLLLGVQKKFYADTLIGLYAAALMIGIGSFADMTIDKMPHETMGGDGRLIVSVWESEDSMRMYYCEPTNAFLRRPLSEEEMRADSEMK